MLGGVRSWWVLMVALVGCGARSGLDGGEHGTRGGSAGTGVVDAGDVPPSFDAMPEMDASSSSMLGCLLLLTDQGEFWALDPVSWGLHYVGPLPCATSDIVNSMTVSRDEVAYVNTASGRLYQVDLDRMECSEVALVDNPFGSGFGMGMVRTETDPEALYAVASTIVYRLPLGWGRFSPLGELPESLAGAELAGGNPGQLFALRPDPRETTVALLDASSLLVRAELTVPTSTPVSSWDLAPFFCPGCPVPEIYAFTADGELTEVTRVDPTLGDYRNTGFLPLVVVGAGGLPCPRSLG